MRFLTLLLSSFRILASLFAAEEPQRPNILAILADDLGRPGNDDFYGAGRVNALKAVLA
ncbi:MAG TPA: hypothetical protein VMY37_39295 [Thermoguttaceae bacterium]|nr:hypothetical protein [Thermoguttaceae bacterium]